MAKTLFAICLFAGVVALASAQSWNYQDCSTKVRAEIDRYRSEVMEIIQKYTNSLQDTAGQATDISAIQPIIDKMTQSITSLGEMPNGIDAGRITAVYIQNIQSALDIGRLLVRPSLITGGLGNNLDLVNKLISLNNRFAMAATTACLPASGST